MGSNVVNYNVKDKVVVLTGGAAGIGAALARNLLADNARLVAFLDIAEKEGFVLESELKAKFGTLRAKFIKCDIANENELYSAFTQVLEKYNKIDIVVNNAAVACKDKEYNKRMIDVNFTATVNSTLKAVDIMGVNNGGTIVNVSSLQAITSTCRLPVYSATKSAVIEFTRSLARELVATHMNIRLLTVCLGPTDTGILFRYKSTESDDRPVDNTLELDNKQRVASAANGIMEVIKLGDNGSTWVIANDNQPVDITENIHKSQQRLKESIQ